MPAPCVTAAAMIRAAWVYTFAGFGLVSACSSSSSSGGDGTGGGPAGPGADFCPQYAKTYVDWMSRCSTREFTAALKDSALKATTDNCRQMLTLSGSTLKQEDLQKCSDGTKAACTEAGWASACPLPKGTLKDGTPCLYDHQCSGGFCRVDEDDTCGKCVTRTVEGEACPFARPCVAEFECVAGTCKARVGVDEDCTETTQCLRGNLCYKGKCMESGVLDGPCDNNWACNEGLVCVDNKCADAGKEGDTCTPTSCSTGLACGADNKCAKMKFVAAGQACDDRILFCESGSCPIKKVCPQLLALGDDCSGSDTVKRCGYGLSCEKDKCELRVKAVCK